MVVVYRNGKSRLVVDYRKFNAMTITDKFLIPRQDENTHARSGSQLLSSFDVLVGFTFTQLEIFDAYKERTAFCRHLGLFVRPSQRAFRYANASCWIAGMNT